MNSYCQLINDWLLPLKVYIEKHKELLSTSSVFVLGVKYHKGIDVEQNFTEALRLYKTVIDQYPYTESKSQDEYSCAMNNLGFMYQYGQGPTQDNKKAFEWYTKASDLGNSCGMNNLGDIYYKGQGTIQDFKKAFEWYTKAANLGNSYSMTGLGTLYYNGQGTTQDYKKAFEWYKKACDLGNSHGINNLGTLYHDGKGTTKDNKKAFEWYKKASDLGNSYGMVNLGTSYRNGQGTNQDCKKAFEWYEKASELENSYGMINLGDMYYNGQGTTQDYKKAFEWYYKSYNTNPNTEGIVDKLRYFLVNCPKSVFKDIISDLFQYQQQYNGLFNQYQELYYSPENPGYKDAKLHFEEQFKLSLTQNQYVNYIKKCD